MRCAFVGCGYVADFYMMTIASHPEFELVGAFDIDAARLARFTTFYNVPRIESFEAILSDSTIELVVNLTNPESHYAISMACLAAGKHVYCEKPLAMELEQARELVATAQRLGLSLSSAPSSLLGDAAQTVWKALREGHIGTPRMVFANLEDDMPFRMGCEMWRSKSGAPWPYRDEFEVGVVLEHAGYIITWLVAFFGPIITITGSSANLFADKMPDMAGLPMGPDFSVANLSFAGGVIARLSCTVIANEDRTLHIYGTKRTLVCDDFWSFHAPVYTWYLRPRLPNFWRKVHNRVHSLVERRFRGALKMRYPAVKGPTAKGMHHKSAMDFLRGPEDMIRAISEGRKPILAPDFCLHVNEAAIALSALSPEGSVYTMTTTCDPVQPMPWAL